ncbi:carboxymuconolactone decarboxylase family protein [Kiloniella sp. b19]|uniref:carboxymuconolactone decarboxylase family protein n=1 Tax=Kiloniella sp. GXU_MW_B19 TaxID=3141326 RepID=UPI0031D93B5A
MTSATQPVHHEKHIGELIAYLGQTPVMMREQGLPSRLEHLIELRVSQINDCAFCVDMHSSAARREGESSERLDRLAAWRHSGVFTPAEKAAFAWAEALTYLERDADYGTLRARLREFYSDEIISLITGCVCIINMWNRLQASKY